MAPSSSEHGGRKSVKRCFKKRTWLYGEIGKYASVELKLRKTMFRTHARLNYVSAILRKYFN